MTTTKRQSGQRHTASAMSQPDYKSAHSFDEHHGASTPVRIAADQNTMWTKRMLTIALGWDPFDCKGCLFIGMSPEVDEAVRCFGALTGRDPSARSLLLQYFCRFNPYAELFGKTLHRRFDAAWESGSEISTHEATAHLCCLIFDYVGVDVDDFWSYALLDPSPDFLALNRHHGWTRKMDNPSHFLEGGLELLDAQVIDVFKFEPSDAFRDDWR